MTQMVIKRNSTPVPEKEIVVKRNPPGLLEKYRFDHPFGGHLPNPPDDCEKSKFIFESRGTRWLDISICHGCPRIKKCGERRRYLTALSEARERYFRGF